MKNSKKAMLGFVCMVSGLGISMCHTAQAMGPGSNLTEEVMLARARIGGKFLKVKAEYIKFLKTLRNDPHFFNNLTQLAQKEFISMFAKIAYEPFAWTSQPLLMDYPNLQKGIDALVGQFSHRRVMPRLLGEYPDTAIIFQGVLISKGGRDAMLIKKAPLRSNDYAVSIRLYELAVWTFGTALVSSLEEARQFNLVESVLDGLLTTSLSVKKQLFEAVRNSLDKNSEGRKLVGIVLEVVNEIELEGDRIKIWDNLERDFRNHLQAKGKLPPDAAEER